MGNLNGKQTISIIIAVLGVLMISESQLATIVGLNAAKAVTSVSALANSILGAVMLVLTGQGAMVKDVLAMPGVERISVNADANKTLSTIAVDPDQPKIAPTTADAAQVNATATAA